MNGLAKQHNKFIVYEYDNYYKTDNVHVNGLSYNNNNTYIQSYNSWIKTLHFVIMHTDC